MLQGATLVTDSREIKAKVTTSGHDCAAAYKELLEQVSVVSTCDRTPKFVTYLPFAYFQARDVGPIGIFVGHLSNMCCRWYKGEQRHMTNRS